MGQIVLVMNSKIRILSINIGLKSEEKKIQFWSDFGIGLGVGVVGSQSQRLGG